MYQFFVSSFQGIRMSNRADLAKRGIFPAIPEARPAFLNCHTSLDEHTAIHPLVRSLRLKEIKLFLRGLYSEADTEITRLGLKGKAQEFGIPASEIDVKELSEGEKKELVIVKRKLADLIATTEKQVQAED